MKLSNKYDFIKMKSILGKAICQVLLPPALKIRQYRNHNENRFLPDEKIT